MLTSSLFAFACAVQAAPPMAAPRAGDFPWLEAEPAHGTEDIRRLVPGVPFVFLETAHFRLACALAPASPPSDRCARKLLETELRVLSAWGLPRPARQLDPRTRAYLYALRCERLYAEVSSLLGVTDADFPLAAPTVRGAGYMGEGPFLGMPRRFTVMLCEREVWLAAYVGTHARRRPSAAGIRHYFEQAGSLFLGIAESGGDAPPFDDRSLHAALAYNLAHNLLDGFKLPWHDVPFWLQEGLAHHFRREVRPDFDYFTFQPTQMLAAHERDDWARASRVLLADDRVTPLRRAMLWLEDRSVAYADQVAMWSRVQFLLDRHPAALATLLRRVKGPELTGSTYTPTPQRLVERQLEALQEALAVTPEGFDEAWRRYVKDRARGR